MENIQVNDNPIEKYIANNLECSNILLEFLKLITIANKKDSKVILDKVSPKELKEETNRTIWGIEISVNLMLNNEGYGKTELFLFNEKLKRDHFYEYFIKLTSN